MTITNSTTASAKPMRNSSIELLRMLSMLMIISHHFLTHNYTNIERAADNPLDYAFLFFMRNGGKVGVIIFFTISSWYFIDRNQTVHASLKRVWILERELIFWALCCFFISLTLNPEALGEGKVQLVSAGVRCLMPVTFVLWWYITCYVLFLIMLPFLQQGLIRLGKRKHIMLCLLLLLVFGVASLIPTSIMNPQTMTKYVWDTPLTFLYLFVLVSCYKLYFRKARTRTLVLVIVASFLIAVPYYVFTYWLAQHGRDVSCQILTTVSLPSTLIGVGAFLLFERWHWHNRAVNFVAKSALAVYLITEYGPIRRLLWEQWFNADRIQQESFSSLRIIGMLLGIYAVCTLLDFVRRGLFKVTVDRHPGLWYERSAAWILGSPRSWFLAKCILPDSTASSTPSQH